MSGNLTGNKRKGAPQNLKRMDICLQRIYGDPPNSGFELLAADENSNFYTSEGILLGTHYPEGARGIRLSANARYDQLVNVINRYRPNRYDNVAFDELDHFNPEWKRVYPGEIFPGTKVYTVLDDEQNASSLGVGLISSKRGHSNWYTGCLYGFMQPPSTLVANRIFNLDIGAIYEAPQEIQHAYLDFFGFPRPRTGRFLRDIIERELAMRRNSLETRQRLRNDGVRVDTTNPTLTLNEYQDLEEVEDYMTPRIGGGKRKKTKRRKLRKRSSRRQRN